MGKKTGAGNLFTVNFPTSIGVVQFTPSGVGSVFASTLVNTPSFIAFQPDVANAVAPLPSVFTAGALMLALLVVRRTRSYRFIRNG